MAIEIKTWRITGLTPLLQNNPAVTMGGSDGDALSTKKKTYVDNDEAEMRTYRNDQGEPVHPTAAFRSAMLNASKGFKVGKRTARTVFAGAVMLCEPEMILTDAKGKPLKSYGIHKCRVIVGKSGVLRCRPMWRDWHGLLPMEIDTDFIDNIDIVTQILNIAGRIIGIGDFRPDTNKGKDGVGSFGRFKAEVVK